ncbi:autotransporter outer membrane beta-barrel domain-containing protein [Camelimonas sp. ID_303_24]
MARLKRTLTSTTALHLLSGALAAPALIAGASAARADCTTVGSVTTCTSAAVNPYPTMIGTGPGDDNRTVTIENGATVGVTNTPAISLGNNAMITIRTGGKVTDHADNNGDGPWGTGNNAIEFGNNGRLLIEAGASVIKTGDQENAEAINVHGSGNVITNYGLVQTQDSAPLWFQDIPELQTGVRNVVENYGQIIRVDNGNLFGSTNPGPDTGIVLINHTGATIKGDLIFTEGNDDLHIYAGSTINGAINGGGGFNSLFLDGAAGTQDQIANHVPNFQALIKEGAGQWTVTGSLDGYDTTTLREGVLTLTGDNSDYQGNVLVENAGVLEARAQSMPVRIDPAANINNIQNDGVVRFTQPTGDDATYVGQITGAGVVEKTGGGVLTLAPDAPAGNTYAGGTIIRGGVVAAAADSAIGAATGPLTLDGGAFRFTSSYDLAATRAVTVTASNGAIDVVAGATGGISQAITGAGALTKSGDGTLILSGNNTWAGGTTIAAGTLQLGNGGASGSLVGDVNNQAQLTINRSGAWTYAGAISGPGAVTQAGPGTTTLTGANTWTGGTTIAAGALQLGNGGATGSLVGDVLNNGQLTFNRSNTYAFDGVVSGSGVVTQAGAGMTLLSNVNTWTGPTHVLAGTLAVGGPASAAAAIAGAGAIDVAAGATLGGYGSVAGNVRNDGVIAVANALSAFSGAQTGNFTIGGQLSNAGLVRLGGAGIGNTLTVGSYTGLGGVIALNTYLGGDGSPSDRLIINGGAGTGSTTLAITNVGGPGAATPGNGILVVSAINGATTTTNAFSTGNLVAGPYQYTLYRGSRDATDPDSWYLRSQAQNSGGGGGGNGGGGGGGGGGGPVIPDYRKETSLYAALPSMALLYGQSMLGTLHERVGEQELQRGLNGANGSPLSKAVWGRVIGSHGNNDGDGRGIYGSGPAFTWDFYAFQIGMDLYRKEHEDGSRDHAGIYIGAGHADGSARHYTGIRAGDMRFDGYTVGAYWTHYGATGWYVDAVAQGTWYSDVKANSGRLSPLSTSGFGVALSLETGYPFALGDGWVLEPQAQIVLQKINFDGGYDGASYVRFSDVQSVAARVGARLSKTWVLDTDNGQMRINAWLRGNVWNEFAGVPKANFTSQLGYVPFRSDMKGAWADISAGITAQFNASTALYAAVSYQTSFDGRRDGWGGKAGVRFTW